MPLNRKRRKQNEDNKENSPQINTIALKSEKSHRKRRVSVGYKNKQSSGAKSKARPVQEISQELSPVIVARNGKVEDMIRVDIVDKSPLNHRPEAREVDSDLSLWNAVKKPEIIKIASPAIRVHNSPEMVALPIDTTPESFKRQPALVTSPAYMHNSPKLSQNSTSCATVVPLDIVVPAGRIMWQPRNLTVLTHRVKDPKLNVDPPKPPTPRRSTIHKAVVTRELLKKFLRVRGVQSSPARKAFTESYANGSNTPESADSTPVNRRGFFSPLSAETDLSVDNPRVTSIQSDYSEVREMKNKMTAEDEDEPEDDEFLDVFAVPEPNMTMRRRRCPVTTNRGMNEVPHELSTITESDTSHSWCALPAMFTPSPLIARTLSYGDMVGPSISEEPQISFLESETFFQDLSPARNQFTPFSLMLQKCRQMFSFKGPDPISPSNVSLSDSLLSFQRHELSAWSDIEANFSDEDYEDDDLKEEGYVSEPGASAMGDKEVMSPMRIRRTNSLSQTELFEE